MLTPAAVCPEFARKKAAPVPMMCKPGPPAQIPSPENVQLQHTPLFAIFLRNKCVPSNPA